jgi:hypothetical protein
LISYDISPDDQRFLMIRDGRLRDETSTRPEVIVVLNWLDRAEAAGAEQLEQLNVGPQDDSSPALQPSAQHCPNGLALFGRELVRDLAPEIGAPVHDA